VAAGCRLAFGQRRTLPDNYVTKKYLAFKSCYWHDLNLERPFAPFMQCCVL
jgi:hypothetical protein